MNPYNIMVYGTDAESLINNNEISIQIQLLEQMKIIYSNIKNYKL